MEAESSDASKQQNFNLEFDFYFLKFVFACILTFVINNKTVSVIISFSLTNYEGVTNEVEKSCLFQPFLSVV